MRKQILTVMVLLSATFSFAQVPLSNQIVAGIGDTIDNNFYELRYKVVVPKNAISFNFGYGIPTVTNALTKQDFWNKKMGMDLSFGIDYKHHFFTSKIVKNEEVKVPTAFGLGFGVGISHLTQQAVMDDHIEFLKDFEDKDNDICDVTLSYKGIKEKVSLTYLDIPFYIEIGKPSQVKLSGYFDVGVKASLLVSGKFTGKGTYSAEGFYKEIDGTTTNVILHNIDKLDYYAQRDAYNNPNNLSKFVLWGCLAGGINIPFSSLEKNRISNCMLRIGARVDYTLLPISKKIAEPYFQETDYKVSQSNMLGGKGSRVLVIGLDVKLIYCF